MKKVIYIIMLEADVDNVTHADTLGIALSNSLQENFKERNLCIKNVDVKFTHSWKIEEHKLGKG